MITNPAIERAILRVLSRTQEWREARAIAAHIPSFPPLEISYTLTVMTAKGVVLQSKDSRGIVVFRLRPGAWEGEPLARGPNAENFLRVAAGIICGVGLVCAYAIVFWSWMRVPS